MAHAMRLEQSATSLSCGGGGFVGLEDSWGSVAPRSDSVATVALAVVDAEEVCRAPVTLENALLFSEKASQSLCLNDAQVLYEADTIVCAVAKVEVLKLVAREVAAFVAKADFVVPEKLAPLPQVCAGFPLGTASVTVRYAPSRFRDCVRISQEGAAEVAVHTAGCD